MEIEILEPIGYCSGVNNAINQAIKAKKENPNTNVIILGHLVHNNHVIKYLESLGIINKVNNNESIDSLNSNDLVIFTAHGHDKKIDDIIASRGVKMVDCVCPKVKANMNLIEKKIHDGFEVIFIGIFNHPETNACLSISEKVHLFDIKSGMNVKLDSSKKVFITNQTTLNFKELDETFSLLKKIYSNAEFNNEICAATRIRQENIINISDSADCVFVVGDKNSSNTKRLFEISTTHNKKASTYLVTSESEISKDMIANKKHVVVTSGTSAPRSIIDSIVNKIKELSK